MVAEVLNRKAVSWYFTNAFIFLSLVVSKVWLPINHGSWPADQGAAVTLAFPMQWYFMNYGPWMSQQMYLVNMTIAVSLFLCLFFLVKKVNLTNE